MIVYRYNSILCKLLKQISCISEKKQGTKIMHDMQLTCSTKSVKEK